ncbi:MAG: translation initiation factor IF-2 subunit beta [Candidatus Wukongarchaeota archaeon]|nr:translation initiation factor IF-2 subunit beta [Candidatus Wukongarchaeota archaeon]
MKTYEKMLKEAEKKISRDISKEGRLEIPPPNVIIQGNRTFITNFTDITNSIRRDPKHLAKFLFRELAKPGHVVGNRLVLQGKAMKNLVQNKIDAYIKEFVLCNECNRPDTNIVKEDRLIFLKCEACGAKQPLRRI